MKKSCVVNTRPQIKFTLGATLQQLAAQFDLLRFWISGVSLKKGGLVAIWRPNDYECLFDHCHFYIILHLLRRRSVFDSAVADT